MSESKSTPPSARGPAGTPPSGGNAMYAAFAGLLLVGMIVMGVMHFRRSSEKTDPGPKQAMASTAPIPTTPAESKLDDVPPPPPIEDAGTVDAAPMRTPTRNQVIDLCAVSSCKGSASPELESALSVRAKQARRCYEAELKNDPALKGKLSLSVRVASNGAVCQTSVASSDVPAINGCVERVFRSMGGFPVPKGGCLDVTVPMSFVPGR